MTSHEASNVVAGIDVGGTKKGFHVVALRGKTIVAMLSRCRAQEAVAWCREHRVSAVAIDAPCRWSLTGRARPCERELAGLGLSCFSTPCQSIGTVHPFYRWMVNGAELVRLLTPHYRIYDDPIALIEPLCFETFPQAIACALSGKRLSAKRKRVDRRRVLKESGLAIQCLTAIDEIDAALCALTAQYVLDGRFRAYGDAVEGFILIPRHPHNRPRSDH
ncbi:MAG TPA: DUF429 domain-containing protein [Nitrospira sp.]|nr:DUF429 domain-containing protein [Nitrospira sp.]